MSRRTIAEQMRDITGVGEDEISKSAAKKMHAVSMPKDGDKKRSGATEKRPGPGGNVTDPDVPMMLKGEREDQSTEDLEDAAEHDNLAPPDGVVEKGGFQPNDPNIVPKQTGFQPPKGIVAKPDKPKPMTKGMCDGCGKSMMKCMCKGVVKSTSVGLFVNDLNGVTDDELSKSVLATHEINERRRKAAREGKLGF